jgi:hypothetical protein
MRRHEPCSHLRPSYDRLELAHYITRDPDTGEISWEPTAIEDELIRLGLIAPNAKQPCTRRGAEDPDT